VVILALGGTTALVRADDYYVATDGDDAANGSLATPWRTIQQGLDQAGPGDTVYVRGGLYRERVAFARSGSAGTGWIRLANHPGEQPVIDGSTLVPAGADALVRLHGRSYVSVEGFEIRSFRSAAKDVVPMGVYVNGDCRDVVLRDLHVHHIESTYDRAGDYILGANAHGLAVYGDGLGGITNLTIRNVTIHDCTLGSSEALVLNGNVTGFEVSSCHVYDNNNIGIDFIGFEGTCPAAALDQARNGICTDNHVHGIATLGNPAYRAGGGYDRSAAGIYVDGGRDIVIERNRVHDCDFGLEVGCEHGGKTASGVTVRNNLFYANYTTGVSFGGYDADRGTVRDCVFVGNTLYHNDTSRGYNGEVHVQFHVVNCRVVNNLVVALSAMGDAVYVGGPGEPGSESVNTVFDYNWYCSDESSNATWTWGTDEVYAFADWRAFGNDANGTHGVDPKLLNTAASDFHLATNSPARNVGQGRADAGAFDLDRQPRVLCGAVDIGADEVPPAITTNGTPTSWLDAHGLIESTYEAADWSDTDNDGMVAWKEYRAGTLPTNAVSVFRLVPMTTPGRVAWLGGTNGVNNPFRIDRRTALRNGTWERVASVGRESGPWQTNVWSDPNTGVRPHAAYRVVAP